MQNKQNDTKQQITKMDIFIEVHNLIASCDLDLGYDCKYYRITDSENTIKYLVVSQDTTRMNVIDPNGKVEYLEF